MDPITTLALPLKGRNVFCEAWGVRAEISFCRSKKSSLPFKGRVRVGMGSTTHEPRRMNATRRDSAPSTRARLQRLQTSQRAGE